MSKESKSCETPDTFVCEDYKEEEAELCELDKSKTYKGLVGIYVDESLITYIDGINGELYYRGYPLHVLVEKSSFEEVAYLLIYGKLPTKSEFSTFNDELIEEIISNRPFLKQVVAQHGKESLAVFRVKEMAATVWTWATNLDPKEYITIK